jgi:tetratricopeptide (TPR) repeat protein
MEHRAFAFVIVTVALGAGVATDQQLTAGVVDPAQATEALTQENAIVLSGAVMLNDSSPPPTSVLVQRTCKGHIESESWTDSQGHYSFKVGRNQTAAGSGDASRAGGPPAELTRPIGMSTQITNPVTSALRDCEMKAVLAGYRSDSIRLAVRSTMDDTRIPTIVLFPLSRADVLAVSVTTEMAPKNARKAYERGLTAIKVQDWDAAGRELARAVKEYPKFAVAWFELGAALEKRGDTAGAVQAWQEAVKADGKYLLPYEKLAAYADRKEQWDEAARYSSAWIQLDPEDFPAAYLLNAIANARLKRMDEAERTARAGLRIDRNRRLPRLSYVLGLILAEKHQYAESVEQFRDYLKYLPNAKDADAVREHISKLDQAAVAAKR